jgi:hypothetical protein
MGQLDMDNSETQNEDKLSKTKTTAGSSYQQMRVWYPIHLFNPATFECLFQANILI